MRVILWRHKIMNQLKPDDREKTRHSESRLKLNDSNSYKLKMKYADM